MNLGNIVEPNSKGQIVIPKKIRDELNINENTSLNVVVRDNGIHLYPITEVTTTAEAEISRRKLFAVLEKTRGAWADEDWAAYDKKEKERRKLELAASRKRQKAW